MKDGIFREGTLGGLAEQSFERFDSVTTYYKKDGQYIGASIGAGLSDSFQLSGDAKCPGYRDPRPDYMASMNKLMVYTGMLAAQGVGEPNLTSLDGYNIHNTVVGHNTGSHNVFHTNYRFFLGAALVEAICICLVGD